MNVVRFLFALSLSKVAFADATMPLPQAVDDSCAAAIRGVLVRVAAVALDETGRCTPPIASHNGPISPQWIYAYWTIDADNCVPFVIAEVEEKFLDAAHTSPWERQDGVDDQIKQLVAKVRGVNSMPQSPLSPSWVRERRVMLMRLYAPTLSAKTRRQIERVLDHCADAVMR
jgi:hypothetical protein